jgi:hypothetical protein
VRGQPKGWTSWGASPNGLFPTPSTLRPFTPFFPNPQLRPLLGSPELPGAELEGLCPRIEKHSPR